jgi:hypothetical protein
MWRPSTLGPDDVQAHNIVTMNYILKANDTRHVIMVPFKKIKFIYKEARILDPRKSSPGARATTGATLITQRKLLTSVNRWSRANILEARVVDCLCEEPIAKLVCARERDTRWGRTASTSDLDLEARNVRLWVSNTSV